MNTMKPRLALGCLLACVSAASSVATAAQPADVTAAHVDVAGDPAGAWARFLSGASLEEAYGAYEVLQKVDYGADGVDAAACELHADALRAAVTLVPVGLALRHAAFQCAEAVGDDAWAAQEMAALAALSRHALDQAGEIRTGRPIRILVPNDAYAMLRAAGIEFLYEYYERSLPTRHYPLMVAAWDAEAGKERHLRFDFIDASNAILHDDTYSGFPFQRQVLAEAILSGHRESGDVAAIDIAAASAAQAVTDPLGKAALLRPAAAQGGILSASAWLLACAGEAPDGCADGLVESLLPQVEARHAVPTLLLAFAHGEGIGVERSPAHAARLLDAAAARWPGQGAVVEYAGLLDAADDAAHPAWLVSRLDAAVAAGDPWARQYRITAKVGVEDATFTAADRDFLASPQANTLGEGFGLLAAKAYETGDETTGRQWLERAADAGHAAMEGVLASTLLKEAADDAERAALRPRFESAAHGGDASAARYLAVLSANAGDWVGAHNWLLAPAAAGHVEAILQLAWIIEQDRPGLPADLPRALLTYRALDSENDLAEARRRLARLALGGHGMEEGADEARAWLLKDAERGDAESQAMLGLFLLQGKFGAPDRAAAERWLLPAIEAGNELATVDFGGWLYYQDKSPSARLQALELWEKGADAGLMMAANNLAWALCTSPDAAVRAPVRGLAVALEMDEAHDLNAAQVDTVAACHAATGAFEDAARVQREALAAVAEMAARNNAPEAAGQFEEMATKMRERLDGYLAREPYVEQAASDDPAS